MRFLTYLVSLTLIICFHLKAHADAVIFSGNDVKALKYNLDLFGRSKLMGLNVDPRSGAGVAAPLGSIGMDYLTGDIYWKSGAGNTQWNSISGAVGSGTPNTFAGYDANGDLYTIPNWGINIINGAYGVDNGTTYTAPADTGNVTNKIRNWATAIVPSVNTSQQTVIGTQHDVNFDRADLGNDFTGTITGVNSITSMEGSGTIGNIIGHDISVTLGAGPAGTAADSYVLNLNSGIDAAFTASTMYGINLGLTGTGTLTNQTLIQANSSTDISSNSRGIDLTMSGDAVDILGTNLNLQGNATNATILNAGFSGDTSNNLTAVNMNITGNQTNDFSGYSLSHNGSVGVNAKLLNIGNSGPVASDIVGGFFNLAGTAQSKHGIQINTSGTVSNSIDGINISQQGDSTTQSIYLINGGNSGDALSGSIALLNLFSNGDADNLVGANITVAGTATNSVSGLIVDVSSATYAGGRKQAANIGGGYTSINGNFTTVSNFPALVDGGHFMTNQLEIVSGTPITGTDFIGNNLSGLLLANDDYSPSAFGLGWTAVGLVGQLSVASTKTVDKANFMIAGGSIPPTSTGGTITEMSMFRSGGLAAAGGTLNITNLYGFKHESLGFTPTNEWAFHNSVAAAKVYTAGQVDIDADLTLKEDGVGTDRLTIQTPVLAAAWTWTLPPTDGSANQFLQTDGAGVSTWETIDAATDITGVLPLANGGTNKALTADAGGIVYSDADSFEITAAGTTGQVLTSNGTGAPTWQSVASAAISVSTITTNTSLSSAAANRLILVDATSGNITITMPAGAGGDVGYFYQFKRTDNTSNTVTIQPNGADTIDEGTQTLDYQYSRAALVLTSATAWGVL